MEIKSSVILGSLHQPISLAVLLPLENYRLSNSQGFLKLGRLTASIYKTGKIQIYGIKNLDDIPKIWDEIIRIVSKYVDVSKADKLPELKFLLAIDKLSYAIDLNKIKSHFVEEDIEYEPEQFPGLIWRFENGTALLFASGSITLTGYSNFKDAENQFLAIKKKLDTFFSY